MKIGQIPNGDSYVMKSRPKRKNPFVFNARADKKGFYLRVGIIRIPESLAEKKFMLKIEVIEWKES